VAQGGEPAATIGPTEGIRIVGEESIRQGCGAGARDATARAVGEGGVRKGRRTVIGRASKTVQTLLGRTTIASTLDT
jgi:hypothetical protein